MRPRPDFGKESYQGTGKLTGRVAIITGADSGIGRAVAVAFGREGADVVISYLNEHEDARETADVVRDAVRRALVIQGDIQQKRHCFDLVAQCVKEFGRVDILVNNAAHQISHVRFMEVTAEAPNPQCHGGHSAPMPPLPSRLCVRAHDLRKRLSSSISKLRAVSASLPQH